MFWPSLILLSVGLAAFFQVCLANSSRREYEYTCANETSYLKVRFSISTKEKSGGDCSLKKLKLKDFYVIDHTNINLDIIYGYVNEVVVVKQSHHHDSESVENSNEYDHGCGPKGCSHKHNHGRELLEVARSEGDSLLSKVENEGSKVVPNVYLEKNPQLGPLGDSNLEEFDELRHNTDEYDGGVVSGNSTNQWGHEEWFDPRFVARHMHLYQMNHGFNLRYIPFAKPPPDSHSHSQDKKRGLCLLDVFTDENGLNYYIDYGEAQPCADLIPFSKHLYIKKGYFWMYYSKEKKKKYRIFQFKKKSHGRRIVCKIKVKS